MTTKTETKQFQYEIQAYQEDCVTNIIRLFESLRQKVNFSEVLTAHHKKNKFKGFCSSGLLFFVMSCVDKICYVLQTGKWS